MRTSANRTILLAPADQPPAIPGPTLIELAKMFTDRQLMDEWGAAEYLGVTVNAVRQAISRGRLPALILTNAVLLVKDDLDAYAAARDIGHKSRLGLATVYRIARKGDTDNG